MSRFQRHMMMGGDSVDPFLRYWWSGKTKPDSTEYGWWRDKVSKVGIATKSIHPNDKFGLVKESYGYRAAAGTAAGIWNALDFGTHFRIVFDARVSISSGAAILIDFDSYRNSNKGFACAVLKSSCRPTMNYKMFGNNSAANYYFTSNSFPIGDEALDGIFEFGNEAYDDTQDILWFRFNGGEKIYSLNPHPRIAHDGMGDPGDNMWHTYLNRIRSGMSYDGVQYSQDILYRDIKIYVYD